MKSFCYLNGMDHISSGEVTFRCSWNVMVKFLEDKGEVVGRIRICLWKILSRQSHNSCCALAHQLMCTCMPRVVQSSISWCAAILHKMLYLCSQTPTFLSGISLELHPRCRWNFILDAFFTASRMYFLLDLWRDKAFCGRMWQICGRKIGFTVTHNVLCFRMLSENVADDSNFVKTFTCARARKMGMCKAWLGGERGRQSLKNWK